jgi:16S rRNA (uracil1498-N3)-methyltransferase
MRLSRFYLDQKLSINSEINLPSETHQYLKKVLRLKENAEITLFNGDEKEYHATLFYSQHNKSSAKIHHQIETNLESNLNIHLIQGISKGDRMDTTLQKSTELGVTEITPIFTSRCQVKLSTEKQSARWQRWHQIVINACEQCGRSKIPLLHPISSFEKMLNQPSLKLLLHHQATQKISQLRFEQNAPVTLLIGPEGGLSQDEILLAKKHQFIPIKLGNRILRTETAALATIAALQTLAGDF